jgi:hypothetical protein
MSFQWSSSAELVSSVFSDLHVIVFPWSLARGRNTSDDTVTFPWSTN